MAGAGAVTTLLTTPESRTVSLFIGGRDCSPIADLAASSIQDNAGNELALADFTLWAALTSTPEVYDQALVRMIDHVADKEAFRGYLTSRHPVTGLEPLIEIKAADVSGLLDDIWIDVELRRPESMQARIGYFWGKYAGAHLSGDLSFVASIGGTLPLQRYAVLTLRQVIEMIIAQASSAADYYVDPTARLHVYTSEVNVAPYNVVVGTPAGGEFAPEDLDIDYDSKQYYNRVFVQGADPSASTFREDKAAITAANGVIRTALLQAPEATTLAQARAVGDLYLARQKAGVARGSFSASSTYDGWRAGQTLTVTEPDIGLSAAPFQLRSVVTRFQATKTGYRRRYGIEFGARQAALAGDGQQPLIAGSTGSIYMLDQIGNSMLSNAATAESGGIGPALRRYILSGVYNGDFYAPPPGPDAPIDNTTNPLPYWSFAVVSGTSVTAISTADAAVASGRRMAFSMAAGAAGDEAYIEQIIPVNGSQGQSYSYMVASNWSSYTTGLISVYTHGQFLRVDGTPTGTEGLGSGPDPTQSSINAGVNNQADRSIIVNLGVTPADAYFVRIRIGIARGSAAIGDTGTLYLNEVRLETGPTRLLITDQDDPSTHSFARMQSNSGGLNISLDSGTGGGTPVLGLSADTVVLGGSTVFGPGLSRVQHYPQGALARRTTTLTGIVSSTWTAIPMDASEDYDPFGFHDTATNPSRFTVPTGWDGTYLLIGHTVGSAGMTPRLLCGWMKNGAIPTNDHINNYNQAAAAGSVFMECSAIMELVAGDYVEFAIWHNTGSNQSSSSPHWASIMYLGERV